MYTLEKQSVEKLSHNGNFCMKPAVEMFSVIPTLF